MKQADDVIIGIDGGGTHTRAMVCDLAGRVLAYAETGAASLHKDAQAQLNVQQAIREALSLAGKELGHVRGIAAGIAGFDDESDREWVEALTDIEGLSCPRWHVNDAVVAHFGALMAQPGIIVISGTGSILLAMTENGEWIRNYDFHHYAASAARFIAYDAVFEALAGGGGESDAALIEAMLRHWEASSVPDLHRLARSGFGEDRRERDRQFGRFAPEVTAAALQGSSLARRVCDRAIDQIMVGIELLAAIFADETVAVAWIGSVVRSPYFSEKLGVRLTRGNNKRYRPEQPRFSPVAGAILYAAGQLDLPARSDFVRHLQASGHSRF